MSRVGWVVAQAVRDAVVAVPVALAVGSVALAAEARHVSRWHPAGIGLGACEAGRCHSRGSAQAGWSRWWARVGPWWARVGPDRTTPPDRSMPPYSRTDRLGPSHAARPRGDIDMFGSDKRQADATRQRWADAEAARERRRAEARESARKDAERERQLDREARAAEVATQRRLGRR